MPTPTALPLPAVRFTDGLWRERLDCIGQRTLPRQWQALNDAIPDVPPSRALRNLRIAAGWEEGEHYGLCFQDSDLAKWTEAACYRVATSIDPTLSRALDEVVELYRAAQDEDGYLHTYTQLRAPDQRWTNLRDLHELYCAGHLIEAAVAHFQATGRRDLLQVGVKFADLLVRTFGPDEGQLRAYPGHPEVELALVRLAAATGDERYLTLAEFFVRTRGSEEPKYFVEEARRRGEPSPPIYVHGDQQAYWQAHRPLADQDEPRGHAVRAMYLYAAMADVARERGDAGLTASCHRLWDEVVARHLYIIGGVGSDGPGGEKFSAAYDLPDDRSYAETCAAIGLIFWARRMLDLELDAKFTEVMERALYNNVLAGISQDGCHYFYVNPLATNPVETHRRYDCRMVKTQRVPWFGCSCCPPNVARLLGALGQYAVSQNGSGLVLHLFAEMKIDWQGWRIRVRTQYPWQGAVRIEIEAAPAGESELTWRASGPVPGADWLLNGKRVDVPVNRGYLRLRRDWRAGDVVTAELPLPIQRVRAHPRLTSAAGRIALQRGPVVYAVEEQDHGPALSSLGLRRGSALTTEPASEWGGGVLTLRGEAEREQDSTSLYRTDEPAPRTTLPLRAVPYAWWGNRGEGEMRIWIRDYET